VGSSGVSVVAGAHAATSSASHPITIKRRIMQFILGDSIDRAARKTQRAVVSLSIDRYEGQKRYDLERK
jgi:hypothetical protein